MVLNRLYIWIFLTFIGSALPFLALKAENDQFTVVIDPGHGGRDPGAVGRRGKEKVINLNVALKLGRLIEQNCRDVDVVYTRSKDVFLPLDRRAQIANNAKADLFISIHTNSVARGRTVRGTETYTLGLHRTDDNLEVAKKENSVILIESDYEQRYAGFNPNSSESYIIFEFLQDKNMEHSVQLATLIQKQFKTTAKRVDKGVHQAGFLVLRETTMPSVLVELGYISTPEEEKYLISDAGQNQLAQSIYQAFLNYRKQLNQPVAKKGAGRPKANAAPEKQPKQAAATPKGKVKREYQPLFKVQIMTSEKRLPAGHKLFKGLAPVEHYVEKGIYKYTYGKSSDYNQILRTKRQIEKKFKGAFIIAFKNGKKMDVNQAIQEFKNNNK